MSAMFGFLWLLSLTSFATTAPPPAAVPPINPDRPDQSDGAGITPKGFPIVEMGYRQTQSAGTVIRQFGDGPLIRYGLCEKFELRFSPGAYSEFRFFNQTFKGMEDASIGFKYKLHEGKEKSGLSNPSFALEGGTSLPTGSHFFREKALQPGLTGIADFSINDNDDLAVNLSYSLLRDNGQQFGQSGLSASFGHQLGPKTGSFLEIFSSMAPSAHGGTHTFSDLGVTYLVNNGIQVDAYAGRNIDSKETQFFFGAGVSFRF